MTVLERLLPKVMGGQSLTRQEARSVMDELSQGQFEEEVASQFLLSLKKKSETSEEIAGFVDSLRSFQKAIVGFDQTHASGMASEMIDVCGTGGGQASTFNVSTTVAFVVASAGIPIAKHGNRSVSSKCGSFDVLEALGLSFSNEGDRIARSFIKFHLGFLFAPHFHPALKSVSELRKKLGVKTVFNLLGPLLNPAQVKAQVVGVYELGLLEKIPHALRELGSREAIVVFGEDSVDEFSISAPSQVAHLKDGKVQRYQVTPESYGLKRAPLSEVEGGDPETNARIILSVLNDEEGAPRDLVLLNSAFAFMVAGRAADPMRGLELARAQLRSKLPLKLLEEMRAFS